MSRLFAVVAGGGTAGHVQPAIAIAESLVELGHNRETIGYVGSRRGLEQSLVPATGFVFRALPGRGIERKVSLRAAAALLADSSAVLLALAYLLRRRPRVVVTVGGYAGFPVALAAWICRIPVVVAESNARPGAANRLAARFARVSAVAFPGSGLRSEELTGNPVRKEIVAIGREPELRQSARRELGLDPRRFTVLVTGGSLGSRTINDATAQMCRKLADHGELAVWHIYGKRDWPGEAEALGKVYGDARAPRPSFAIDYRPVEYEERMDRVLAACDLVISRAGATTVAELCAAGRASLLVPLPGAPGDHQTANARVLAEVGACSVVPDEDCSGSLLADRVSELGSEPETCVRMGRAALSLARPDAARSIARLAERWAEGRGGLTGSRPPRGSLSDE